MRLNRLIFSFWLDGKVLVKTRCYMKGLPVCLKANNYHCLPMGKSQHSKDILNLMAELKGL